MWGKIIIPMYRLWLHSLYGLYGPRCPLSPKREINLISLSLLLFFPWILSTRLCCAMFCCDDIISSKLILMVYLPIWSVLVDHESLFTNVISSQCMVFLPIIFSLLDMHWDNHIIGPGSVKLPWRIYRTMYELLWIMVFGHEWGDLPVIFNHWQITSQLTKKSLFTVMIVLFYFLQDILCPEQTILLKTIIDCSFPHCHQGRSFLT